MRKSTASRSIARWSTKRPRRFPSIGDLPDNPETLLIKRTLAPELQAAVDELPDQFREAVWLRDVGRVFL